MRQTNSDNKNQRSSKNIIISSQAAAFVTNIALTPSEVLKIRQQKGSLQMKLLNKKLPYNPTSLSQTFLYIIKNEGLTTFTNGMKYNLLRAHGSNFTMFLTYEKVKQYLLNYSNNFYIVPIIASGFSQMLATTVTFPFEYWKTVQQSHKGKSKVEGLNIGTRLYSAYLITVKKNMLFHTIYWTISENMRKKLGYYRENNQYETQNKNMENIMTINAISGAVGAISGSIFTAPLDIVKTRKQLFPEKFSDNHSYRMILDIIKNEGVSQLYVGVKPMSISCMIYGSCMLSVYESTFKFLESREAKNNNQQFM